MEETFEKNSIIIHIDGNGHITSATDINGKELKYHPDEPKRLHNTKTRLLTPNDCCWRKTPLGMRCSPSYC